MRIRLVAGLLATLATAACAPGHAQLREARPNAVPARPAAVTLHAGTATPIQHLIVIYDENVSFDHYFGTYPHAANPPGEPAFHPRIGTPRVNGLTPALLLHNPNLANPSRLDRSQAMTCDNDHGYVAEQRAFDHGRMDRFVQETGPHAGGCDPTTVMRYYDGNTVTALWNYAQRYAMNDNSFDATFGPTLPGHLNLVAGQTHGRVAPAGSTEFRPRTITVNTTARYEDCALPRRARAVMSGRNIGDLLSAARVSWGYFSAGFRASARNADGTAVCKRAHRDRLGRWEDDYYVGGVAEPFQYWSSTANPHHVRPASVREIGHDGRARHQYDLRDFWSAASAGQVPAVSFLKPPGYQNGHAGTSDPLSEQRFLVETINRIQRLPIWPTTAVVIAYDDSDGWYDHVAPPVLGSCTYRCGPGPRQPLLVVSPFAKRNYVDHTMTTQVSITRFIEDNWLGGRRIGGGSFDADSDSLDGMFSFAHPDARRFILSPETGQPATPG